MNKRKNTRTLSRYTALPILLGAALLSPSPSHATPYATSLTNNGNTISFRLNESGIVTLQWTNLAAATVTSNLNLRAAGLTTTNISIPGDFTVIVAKTNTAGYVSGVNLQINGDGTNGVSTNTLRFNAPRGVAVNTNPASAYFGRIYVSNSGLGIAAPRTNIGDGIFLLNADFSDAVAQGTNARTAGITTFTNSTGDDLNSPWRLSIGEDNNLYISDFSANSGTIYVTDPDVLTGTNVLAGLGLTGSATPINPSPNHGRFCSSVIARGSTNAGNLVIYAIDSDNSTTSDFTPNHIMKYAVGAGPLPVDLTVGVDATNVDNSSLLAVAGITTDLAAGPDGKFYSMQNRSDGNEGGLYVVDPVVDGTSVYFPGADGLWDTTYDSKAASLSGFGITNDILRLSRAVAISPDGKYMGIVRDDNQIWVIGLTNGIPDLSARRLVATTPTTSIGRDICFDAAGNLYVVSSGNLLMRSYSPGYITVAKTSLSGTFSVTNIAPPEVKLVANLPFPVEGTSNGSFTFSRSGDTSGPLTVNYVISGTATRGVDYATNVFGIGGGTTNSITFASGVSATNVPINVIDDSIGEVPETVIFTMLTSTNYALAINLPVTNTITDDGIDLPLITVRSLGLGFNELLPNRPARFVLSISSTWNADVVANVSLSGTAVSGVDYAEANSYTVTIPQGQTAVTNRITPIDNTNIAPDKILIYTILAGAGYTNLGTLPVTNTLRNDDLAPQPILFSDNFDVDSSASWKTNAFLPDNDVAFAYDYGTLDGIPLAPHTTNGTSLGMKLRSHFTGAVSNGISVSPIGLVLTNDYRMRFDAWLNFNGPAPTGGAGSTEFLSIGMGVSENRTNVVGSTSGAANVTTANLAGSSVIFAVDGDGGFAEATGDYMVYSNCVPVALNTNIYPGNSRDNGGTYYAEFGEIPIPSAQTSLFPSTQTGYGAAGSLAFTWHDVIVTKVGNTYTLDIDGLRFININYPLQTVGSNFSLGYFDQNASITAVPQMNAAIIDNLTVEKLPPSTNANLANLILTPGALVPGFNANTLAYTSTNGTGTNYTITATVSHPVATLQLNVNGGGFAPLTSGVASGTLPLNVGANTVVVRVTAPDATTVQDYTLNAVLVSSGPSLTVPTLTNSVSGGVLTMSWPADHIGFSLQTQTNAINAGLGTNWFVVPGSTTTNTVSVTIDPTKPTVFYRLVYP